jgi:hypothetical protein
MLTAAATKKPTLVDVATIGRKGGKARAKSMTPEERSESARKAVTARWAKARKEKKEGKGKDLDANGQVLLSVGIPTLAVLVGILINNRQVERLERHMDAQFLALRSELTARFEAAQQALLRVEGVLDARLKHLEARER